MGLGKFSKSKKYLKKHKKHHKKHTPNTCNVFTAEQAAETGGQAEARAAADAKGGGEGLVQVPGEGQVEEGVHHEHHDAEGHRVAPLVCLRDLRTICGLQLRPEWPTMDSRNAPVVIISGPNKPTSFFVEKYTTAVIFPDW